MKIKQYIASLITYISNIVYIVGSISLACISLTMIGYTILSTISAFYVEQFQITKVLESVSLIVISLAVFDVARFFIEEEVLLERRLRSFRDFRRTISKFIVTISIAVFLEALVSTFVVIKTDISMLFYPSVLFVAAFLLVVGLTLVQQFGSKEEIRD